MATVMEGSQQYLAPDRGDFHYKPTPVIVPVSVVMGLISSTSLLGIVGVILAVMGSVVGLIGFWTLQRNREIYSGFWAAIMGMLLSVGFTIAGISNQIYAYNTEVPDGFARVSFSQDISAKQFVVKNGQTGLHPEVEPLLEKSIFLKGYMYPQRQTQGLKQFLLLKDTGECCFGGQPQPTDMILVNMEDPHAVNYRQGRVSVAGKFRLTNTRTSEGLQPVYAMDATFCERSRTSF